MHLKSISKAMLLFGLMSLSLTAISQTQSLNIPLHEDLEDLENNTQIKQVEGKATPYLVKILPSEYQVSSAQIRDAQFEPTEELEEAYQSSIGEKIRIETSSLLISGKPYIRLEIVPYKKENGNIYKLTHSNIIHGIERLYLLRSSQNNDFRPWY